MNTFLFSRGIRADDLYHTSNDMGFPSVQKGEKLHSPHQLSKKERGPYLMKFIGGPTLKDLWTIRDILYPEEL